MYYGKELDGFINSEINVPYDILNSNPKLINIKLGGTSTDGETEINPVSNKMQLSTAEKVKVVSSSANDNSSATGHVQKVTIIGVDENDNVVREEITLDDTDGTTAVESTNSYKDVWHSYASSWGSGDLDAAGNIDVTKQDDTVISRIAAGSNEGEGSGILIPDDHLGSILKGYLNASGSQATNEGKQLKIYINDVVDQETDTYTLNYIELDVYGYVRLNEVPSTRVYQDSTEITFFINRIADGNEDFFAQILVLLWEK